jgi:hypothetical protein
MTTTQQLNRWMMRRDRTYLGAFALDKVPSFPPPPCNTSVCFIVNTQTANLPGQHWIAVRCVLDRAWIFDPLASPLGPPPELCDHLLLHCQMTMLHFCKTMIQPLNTTTCGYHCVYFLLMNCGAPSESAATSFISKL